MTRTMLLFLFITSCIAYPISAQVADGIKPPASGYYIDVNAAAKNFIFNMEGDILRLKYNDSYGEAAAIQFSLFDWKGQTLSQLSLTKQFGLNYFDIETQKRGIALSLNETYRCTLLDEKGNQYEVYFKYLPSAKVALDAEIMVKPMLLQCDDPSSGNLIEFFGMINGGKAPYQLNWYILNKERTDLLYQPREVTLKRPGYTASVEVDKSPEYYVLLYVKDACGSEVTRTVQVVCEGNKKKINTLFLQSVDEAFMKNTIIKR